MTSKSRTLIFFGNELLASGIESDAPIFRMLIEEGYLISHLIINQSKISSRKSKQLAIEQIANQNSIPILRVKDMKAVNEVIKLSGAKAGILAAFGKIIPEETIKLFDKGIINIHPSLLPHNRGSSPIETTIMEGGDGGVSIMSLNPKMDAGPIYASSTVSLPLLPSKQQVYEHITNSANTLMKELLPKILDGSLIPKPQDHSQATYTARISKSDGVIDWNRPAAQIERQIRAYLGWPGSTSVIGNQNATITKANIILEQGKPGQILIISKTRFAIFCSQDAIEILSLKPDGKKEMSAQAFLAGYKNQLS